MTVRKALSFAGIFFLTFLVLAALVSSSGHPSRKHLLQWRADMELRQFGAQLLYDAEAHCDNFAPPIHSFSGPQCAISQDRRRLIVYERTLLPDDHRIAYLELNLCGAWPLTPWEMVERQGVMRVTEQQFSARLRRIESLPSSPTPADRLVAAVERGDRLQVRALMNETGSVDEEDDRGWTPLTMAVQVGLADIVNLLLVQKAKLNLRDHYGLGRTALMRACALGQATIAETLVAHGGDVHVQRQDGNNALTDALPFPDLVLKLIQAGADANQQIGPDASPLIAACAAGFTDSARLLIEHGASLNRDGRAALEAASQNGRADVIDTLFAQGLQADKRTLGQCLSWAYSHPEAMQKLIAAGADLNAPCACGGGRTALMISALNGCASSVDVLIKAGADLNAKDDRGHTALDLMLADTRPSSQPDKEGGQPQLLGIVNVLRKSGAKDTGSYVVWPEPR